MCNTISVMLIPEKGSGRFTLKLNYSVIASITVSVVFLLFFSLSSFVKYISAYSQNQSFQVQICQLEKNFNEFEKEKKEADAYKNWSNNIIARKLNYEEKAGRGNMGPSANTLNGEIKDKTMRSSSILSINELDIRRANLHLDFNMSFKLINRTKRHHEQKGYLFVVASNNEVVPGIYNAWPAGEIISGLPKDYKLGSPFSIRHMKVVKGKINQPDIGQKFNRIDLIAYSENGDLLLKKGIYIEKLLLENPFE